MSKRPNHDTLTDTPSDKALRRSERERRLAAALRENLRKRKQQQRARAQAARGSASEV